jgi:ubiquinone biosynthesis protein
MFKFLKGILFLINILFIFGTEFLLYFIFYDYSSLVERLAIRLSSVNILCVKIFQAFSLNNSLIDEKINNKLLQFTDKAPWNYNDINIQDLIAISKKYHLIFDSGYETPINAGMISLVFKVYKKYSNHPKSEPFIIKIKRNNIEEKLNDAIDNLLFLIYLLSFIPILNNYNYQFKEIINKNIEIIRHQTNFIEEVDNLNKIKINCKNLKYVKIPFVERKVTEEYPNCILMEFINGIKINEIKKEDYEGFAKQIIKFGFVTTIIHGLTHGDLHGGNILFIKNNDDDKYPYKIGVFDFGIIYKLESEFKEILFEIITQIFVTDLRESAIKILNCGILEPRDILQKIPKQDYENIIDFTKNIIYESIHLSEKANQIQIYKFICKLKDYLCHSKISNYEIKLSDNFMKIQLVLAMSHGITLKLCNNDFIKLADEVINELFHINMLN